jgi:hypothetical protein
MKTLHRLAALVLFGLGRGTSSPATTDASKAATPDGAPDDVRVTDEGVTRTDDVSLLDSLARATWSRCP